MPIQSKTILLIHGAFVTYLSWTPWKEYLEGKGYKVIVEPWPHKAGNPADLRKQHPNSPIASLRLLPLIEHYTNIIKSLPEKPIIIGHSFGGLLTQLLINRGLGAAGIAIHPVPPQGVIPLQWSFYKSTWGALGLFTSAKKTYLMSRDTWKYAFTNRLSAEEQKRTYDENVIPESKLLSRDALTSAGRIDFKKEHAPLLIMAGEYDNIIPAGTNYSNYKKYAKNNSVTEFKKFPKTHFVVGEEGWQDTVDYIINWVNTH